MTVNGDNGNPPPKLSTEMLMIVLTVLVSACLTISVLAFPDFWGIVLGSGNPTPAVP